MRWLHCTGIIFAFVLLSSKTGEAEPFHQLAKSFSDATSIKYDSFKEVLNVLGTRLPTIKDCFSASSYVADGDIDESGFVNISNKIINIINAGNCAQGFTGSHGKEPLKEQATEVVKSLKNLAYQSDEKSKECFNAFSLYAHLEEKSHFSTNVVLQLYQGNCILPEKEDLNDEYKKYFQDDTGKVTRMSIENFLKELSIGAVADSHDDHSGHDHSSHDDHEDHSGHDHGSHDDHEDHSGHDHGDHDDEDHTDHDDDHTDHDHSDHAADDDDHSDHDHADHDDDDDDHSDHDHGSHDDDDDHSDHDHGSHDGDDDDHSDHDHGSHDDDDDDDDHSDHDHESHDDDDDDHSDHDHGSHDNDDDDHSDHDHGSHDGDDDDHSDHDHGSHDDDDDDDHSDHDHGSHDGDDHSDHDHGSHDDDGDDHSDHDDHSGHDHGSHSRRKRSTHDHDTNQSDRCYSVEQLLDIFEMWDDISDEKLMSMCPALIQQIKSGACAASEDDHGHSTSSGEGYTQAMIYGYGTASVAIISALALLGLALFPSLHSKAVKYTMQFFIGLGIGTMAGDALLHIIPHILGLHNHDEHDHGAEGHEEDLTFVWKMSAVLGGIYAFFVFDNCLRMFKRLRKKTDNGEDIRPSDHSVPVRDEEGNVVTSFSSIEARDNKRNMNESSSSVSSDELKNKDNIICYTFTSTLVTVFLGDILHNFADGLAIGVSFTASWPAGIGASLAILCHELPHEIGDFAIYLKNGATKWQALGINFVAACCAFLGLYTGIGLGTDAEARGWLMAVVAGMFLYISLVQVLVEMVNEEADNPVIQFIIQNIGLLLGWALMLLISIYEDDLHGSIKA